MCAERRRCDDPHCPLCRATDTPAVAGPTLDLQQAIHAATKALRDIGVPGGDPAKRYAHVAVTTAWGFATGSANQHHWKRTAVNKMEQLQAAQAENATLKRALTMLSDQLTALEHHAALGQVDQP